MDKKKHPGKPVEVPETPPKPEAAPDIIPENPEQPNDFHQHHYGGPCPPSGTHRYFFKIYALDTLLDLPGDTDKFKLEKMMHKHIIAVGELIGLYKRNS